MKNQPIHYRRACATDVAKTFQKHGFVPPSSIGYQKSIREQLNNLGLDEDLEQPGQHTQELTQPGANQ